MVQVKTSTRILPRLRSWTTIALVAALVFSAYFPTSSYAANEDGKPNIRLGERYFKGLLPFNRTHEACVSCHNIKPVDTFNWNPSAYEIALKYHKLGFASFEAVVMSPLGGKMAEVHKDFEINEEGLIAVKAYLDTMVIEGPYTEKPTHFNLILFLFLGLIITWALIELLFVGKIKLKFIPLVLLAGALGWQAKMVVGEAINLGRQQYYAPDQPIKFSHQVHSGDHGIDCMYCHTVVEHSKSAGIPATSLCMNCHVLIREGSNSGRFEINKVVDAFENGHHIEWIKVHNLPDHVFFSHAQHVGSGKLDCTECHGAVDNMHKLTQVNDLSMGWCLDCHRNTEVQFTTNKFYETYEKLHRQFKAGDIERITADMVGGEDCMKCHY